MLNKKRRDKPQFFICYKDFNDGKLKPFDALAPIFEDILTKSNKLRKKYFFLIDFDGKVSPITTKEQLSEFLDSEFGYRYWSKCEYEFIIIDWPNKEKVGDSRPVKVDAYSQLKLNLPLITNLVWDYLEPLISK